MSVEEIKEDGWGDWEALFGRSKRSIAEALDNPVEGAKLRGRRTDHAQVLVIASYGRGIVGETVGRLDTPFPYNLSGEQCQMPASDREGDLVHKSVAMPGLEHRLLGLGGARCLCLGHQEKHLSVASSEVRWR